MNRGKTIAVSCRLIHSIDLYTSIGWSRPSALVMWHHRCLPFALISSPISAMEEDVCK